MATPFPWPLDPMQSFERINAKSRLYLQQQSKLFLIFFFVACSPGLLSADDKMKFRFFFEEESLLFFVFAVKDLFPPATCGLKMVLFLWLKLVLGSRGALILASVIIWFECMTIRLSSVCVYDTYHTRHAYLQTISIFGNGNWIPDFDFCS